MSRRASRRAAVEVLYAADVRGQEAGDLAREQEDFDAYATHLVDGVCARREEIDLLLSTHAIGWRPERMSAVDRNVLRVGVLELLEGDVPPAAVIDEAVELAKGWSGAEAGRFVNGVLAAILAQDGSGGRGSSEAGSGGGS